MKAASLVFSLLCWTAWAAAQEGTTVAPPMPPELVAISQSWTDAKTKSQLAVIQRKGEAKAAYLTGLSTLDQQAQQKGDLTNLLALRAEKDRIQAGQETTAEMRQEMSPELRAWRGKYEAALQAIEAESSRTEQALRAKCLQELQTLQVALTKQGNLEAALAVKDARDKLLAESAPVAASPTAPTAPGGAGPALFGVPAVPGGVPAAPPRSVASATEPPKAPAAAPTPSSLSDRTATEKLIKMITSGDWKRSSGGEFVFTFDPDGTMRFRGFRVNPANRWKVTSPRTVEYSFRDENYVRKATFAADLETVTYTTPDGLKTAKFLPR